MTFKLGELFCGPGGIAWGATHADIGNPDFTIVHQWANDYDADTCDTYRHNICPDSPNSVYHEDIRKLSNPTCKVLAIFSKQYNTEYYNKCTYLSKGIIINALPNDVKDELELSELS